MQEGEYCFACEPNRGRILPNLKILNAISRQDIPHENQCDIENCLKSLATVAIFLDGKLFAKNFIEPFLSR